MIIYSIIPSEIIFSVNGENNKEDFIEVDYKGERVFVSKKEDNKYVIERIISTSPMAFLNPEIQPGIKIKGLI